MTCREAATLLPRFFDGELDAHKMRLMALHSTRCETCEAELRRFERVQAVLHETVNAAVDAADFAHFWSAIEPRLGTTRVSRWERLSVWWTETDRRWLIRVPTYAVATGVVVFAVLYGARYLDLSRRQAPQQLAEQDTQALIHKLQSTLDVSVLNDPEATVLWVNNVGE